jgi:hypothetical protein
MNLGIIGYSYQLMMNFFGLLKVKLCCFVCEKKPGSSTQKISNKNGLFPNILVFVYRYISKELKGLRQRVSFGMGMRNNLFLLINSRTSTVLAFSKTQLFLMLRGRNFIGLILWNKYNHKVPFSVHFSDHE